MNSQFIAVKQAKSTIRNVIRRRRLGIERPNDDKSLKLAIETLKKYGSYKYVTQSI